MAEETLNSTPAETVDVDTSSSIEPETVETVNDTSIEEPTSENDAAENDVDSTEKDKGERLYANKYKSVEDLEKGYNEAQKFVTKASEFEKKYNELIEAQKQNEQKSMQEQLLQAQRQGFNTVNEQQIAQQSAVAEFELYANGINTVNPEYFNDVRSNLLQYYQTGNKAFLNEAKKYFPSDFIENVAIQKQTLENQLKGEFKQKERMAREAQEKELAEVLKADFSEFLSDLNENQGKAKALEAFCNTGLIQTKEDMQVFQDIYSLIENTAKENAVKEYLANKAIEETKNKSIISNGAKTEYDGGGLTLKTSYSDSEIKNMPYKQFEALEKKFGEEFYNRIN